MNQKASDQLICEHLELQLALALGISDSKGDRQESACHWCRPALVSAAPRRWLTLSLPVSWSLSVRVLTPHAGATRKQPMAYHLMNSPDAMNTPGPPPFPLDCGCRGAGAWILEACVHQRALRRRRCRAPIQPLAVRVGTIQRIDDPFMVCLGQAFRPHPVSSRHDKARRKK